MMNSLRLFPLCVLLVLLAYSAQEISVLQRSQDTELDIFDFEHGRPTTGSRITFSFAKYFQDHMVLQQAPKRARIYGYSPFVGHRVIAVVTTSTRKYLYMTKVHKGPAPGVGKWVFTLDPIKTSSPVTIYVGSIIGIKVLRDVLFGDVWLCSGQSNMEFTLSMMNNGTEEIKSADDYPNIRIMTVQQNSSNTPRYDLIELMQNWSVASSKVMDGPPWTYFSALCWLYGKAIYKARGYPIGLISSTWYGISIEAWSSTDALAKCNIGTEFALSDKDPGDSFYSKGHENTPRGPHENNAVWNSMVRPFLGLTFYGIIWFQGENNGFISSNKDYGCLFPALVEDWRLKFSRASDGQTTTNFPFGFVQLGPMNHLGTGAHGFTEIRWHQTADIGYAPNPKLPNTFMATAVDQFDFDSIYLPLHPQDKEDLGHRLALGGLAVAYNHTEILYQGPFPVKASVTSRKEILINYGLRWTLVFKSVEGFDVLCAPSTGGEERWIPTPIISQTNTTLSLYLGVCGSEVKGLRYIWRNTPCPFKGCAVYSLVNDLPATPFIAYAERDQQGNIIFPFK